MSEHLLCCLLGAWQETHRTQLSHSCCCLAVHQTMPPLVGSGGRPVLGASVLLELQRARLRLQASCLKLLERLHGTHHRPFSQVLDLYCCSGL